MTEPDAALPSSDDAAAEPLSLATQAPLARGAVIAALAAVVFGFTFLPQLIALALGGLSLARRERAGRRYAALAIGLSLVFTVVWAFVLGLLLKWWASTRVA